jgi:large subunit ribosomal protein L27e
MHPVAGIDRPPRAVTKAMGKKKLKKRSKIKPFIRHINQQHIMPTRYAVDFDMKKLVDINGFVNDPASRPEARKAVKATLEQRYLNQAETRSEKSRTGIDYFFTKLRF